MIFVEFLCGDRDRMGREVILAYAGISVMRHMEIPACEGMTKGAGMTTIYHNDKGTSSSPDTLYSTDSLSDGGCDSMALTIYGSDQSVFSSGEYHDRTIGTSDHDRVVCRAVSPELDVRGYSDSMVYAVYRMVEYDRHEIWNLFLTVSLGKVYTVGGDGRVLGMVDR